MKNLSTRWMLVVSLMASGAVVNLACSSSDGNNDAGGGTGGRADSGSGTGGRADSGAGGAPVVTHVLEYNFDSSDQMWTFNNGYGYDPPTPTTDFNLAPPPVVVTDAAASDAAGDAGGGDAGAPIPVPTLTFDNTVGSPTAGSLKVSVTFTSCNQFVEPAIVLAPTKNLTGKTLHGRLQVTSGQFSGGAQLYLQTGANYDAYVSSGFTLAANGTFASAAIDLTTAVAATGVLDPSNVIHVGIKIFSGYSCAAPYANPGVPVVFNIDSVTD